MITVIVGYLTVFLYGATLSWSTPEIPKLLNETTTPLNRPVTIEEASWLSSIVLPAMVIGAFLFCYLSEKIGRKLALLSTTVPLASGYFILAFGTSIELYYIARFIVGLGGGVFILMPLYAGEILEKRRRGAYGSVFGLSITAGFLFTSFGPYMSSMILNLILAIIALMFGVLFAIFGHEVPYYYLRRNEHDKAKKVLQKIRGNQDVLEEFNEIEAKCSEKSEALGQVLRSRGLRRAFIMSLGLQTGLHFSGINGVIFYSQIAFQDIKSGMDPVVSTIIVNVVQFLSSFIAPFVGDRFPRKTNMSVSAIILCFSNISLAAYCYFRDSISSSFAFVPLLAFVVFITVFSSGFGPLVPVLLSELFPLRVKSTAMSVTNVYGAVLGFLITKYFFMFIQNFGLSGYYLFCAAFNVSIAAFIKFYFIETRGKTLEAIEDELNEP
nr:unnamed protein product [Callosobruchus chinensis]